MPRLSTWAGFKTASKISSRSPVISASRTCGRLSMRRFKSLARFCNSRSGALPQRLTVMIGKAEVLISSTMGSSASSGNSARARSTFSSTSVSVCFWSNEASNSIEMIPTLVAPTPFSSLRPSRLFSSVSSGRTSSLSASSGEMPGRTT